MEKISANGSVKPEQQPTHNMQAVPGVQVREYHPGNRKRLVEELEVFSLTMQHAMRANLKKDLEHRAKEDAEGPGAGILPPLTAAEMFDFLMASDPEFLNWIFPFCPVLLTPANMSYTHQHLINKFRMELNETDNAEQQ